MKYTMMMRIKIFKIIPIALLAFIILYNNNESLSAQKKYAFIKSANLPQYDEVMEGFKQSFPDADTIEINLAQKADADKIKSFISSENPSILICLGAIAATAVVKAESKIPIVFAMVLNYKRYPDLSGNNITGISMEIYEQNLFTQFRLLYPSLSAIGVPYNPGVSEEIIKDAVKNVASMNVKIIPIRVEDPADMMKMLISNKDRFNGLWMIADPVLYNNKTSCYKDILSFSLDSNKPLLAPSEPFVKGGCFFSVSINYKSIGSQLALISRRILEDNVKPEQIPVALPIGTFTVVNKDTAKKILGVQFNEASLNDVDMVYPEEAMK